MYTFVLHTHTTHTTHAREHTHAYEPNKKHTQPDTHIHVQHVPSFYCHRCSSSPSSWPSCRALVLVQLICPRRHSRRLVLLRSLRMPFESQRRPAFYLLSRLDMHKMKFTLINFTQRISRSKRIPEKRRSVNLKRPYLRNSWNSYHDVRFSRREGSLASKDLSDLEIYLETKNRRKRLRCLLELSSLTKSNYKTTPWVHREFNVHTD